LIEARWSSRGYSAQEATVTVLQGDKEKVIFRFHVIKDRQFGPKDVNYSGSSKGLDGFGVMELIKILKAEKMSIRKSSHDNDATTRLIITKEFPNALGKTLPRQGKITHSSKGGKE
jgi:hypothetical protein